MISVTKWVALIGAMSTAIAVLPSYAVAAENTVRAALVSEAGPLDPMMSTIDGVLIISNHIYEALYTLDEGFNVRPMLAEGEEVSEDGLTIKITLRQGVKFHNGKELTSADVIASLDRWKLAGLSSKQLMERVASVEATGPYEITFNLSEPSGTWKAQLANLPGGPVIYPAEVAEQAGAEPLSQDEYIGTGPFKFQEWLPNRRIELVKFDDYVSRDDEPSGFAGAKVANFDSLQFYPVPDASTRLNGVKAGDYEYAQVIPGDLYEELATDSSVKVLKNGAPFAGLFFINNEDGLFKDNYPLRRAVQQALDKASAMSISLGPQTLWAASGSMFPPGSDWYSEAGVELYNQADPEGAKAAAEAAGYDGTPVRILVSTSYQFHYDQALVFSQQLQAAGINTELIVVDWPTLVSMRAQADKWDMFVTHSGLFIDPALTGYMNPDYPGWWRSPEINELRAELISTVDQDARKQIWEKIHALFYEQVPFIKVGDSYSYDIASPKIDNLGTPLNFAYFWNASF